MRKLSLLETVAMFNDVRSETEAAERELILRFLGSPKLSFGYNNRGNHNKINRLLSRFLVGPSAPNIQNTFTANASSIVV